MRHFKKGVSRKLRNLKDNGLFKDLYDDDDGDDNGIDERHDKSLTKVVVSPTKI